MKTCAKNKKINVKFRRLQFFGFTSASKLFVQLILFPPKIVGSDQMLMQSEFKSQNLFKIEIRNNLKT